MLLSLVSLSLFSQITIRNSNIENTIQEEPIAQYDSLTNLREQKRPIDYQQYIGQLLFFIPQVKRVNSYYFYKSTFYRLSEYTSRRSVRTEKTEIKYNNLEGKYFTIIDIYAKEYHERDYRQLADFGMQQLETPSMLELKLLLQEDNSKNIVYWETSGFMGEHIEYYILVPYFEKIRDIYLNQNFVFINGYEDDKTNTYEDYKTYGYGSKQIPDIKTGVMNILKHGDMWTCSDVSFADSEYQYDYFLRGYCFFKNGDKEIKVAIDDKLLKRFMLEEAYNQREVMRLQKIVENKRILKEEREQNERIKKEQQAKHLKECIAKWGKEKGTLIANKKVQIGMTKEMCTAAWGKPQSINTTISNHRTHEQWVYGIGTYLYFENGILITVQK